MPRILLLAPLVGSCLSPATAPDAPTCAWQARAHAARIADGDWTPTGPEALAQPGDLLLANPHAAFVIQGPDNPRTYYHYGGIPIDAAPMDGCTQTAPDHFGELGLVPARLDLLAFEQSTMRQFRATTAEVVADGSDGGPARVRLTGVDDRFWLVDYTLTRSVAAGGGRRPLSDAMGVSITVEYVLRPGSPVLEIEVTTTNVTDADNPFLLGAIAFPSARTPLLAYSEDAVSFGGFGLDTGVPWVSLASDETGYAIAKDTSNLAYVNVSGARALLDAEAVLSDGELAPSGQGGDVRHDRWLLAVGARDDHAAIAALHEARPTFNGAPYELRTVRGRVDGAVVPAAVHVQRDATGDGDWRTLDRLHVDDDGRFEARLPDLGPMRLLAVAGRQVPSPPLELDAGDVESLELTVGDAAWLHVQADDDGTPIPAQVSLYRDGHRHHVLYAPPAGERFEVPPGAWSVSLTRGYEHLPVHTDVELVAGETTKIEASLPRIVDTSGWLSVDGHIHTSPSPDSDVLPERRFATVAAAGLDVMVQTDHEAIADLSEELASSPWDGTLVTMLGEEVTASVPEHMNMYGVPLGPEHGVRGAPVIWQGRDMGQIFQAMRARGAGVVQLNHPGWMNDIDYDPVTGVPGATDPTRFGLTPQQQLWSWDFDAIELSNGHKFIFGGPDKPGSDGLLRAWMGFHNLGHRITAVGTSDVHGMETPGTPRTYVPASDDLDAFVEGPVLQALLDGRAVVSSGAFALVAVGDDVRGAVADMGQTFTVTGDAPWFEIEVRALPGIQVDRVVLFANCDAIAERAATDPAGRIKLATRIPVELDADAHLVAVVLGSGAYPRGLEQPAEWVARAVTNPVFVDVDGNGTFDPPGPKDCDLSTLPQR